MYATHYTHTPTPPTPHTLTGTLSGCFSLILADSADLTSTVIEGEYKHTHGHSTLGPVSSCIYTCTCYNTYTWLKKCHCSIQNRLYMYVLTHTPWFNTCTVQLAITYQTVSLLCIATSSLTLLDLNCLQRVLTYGSSSKYKS